jgi:hypothetical protein
MYEKITSVKGLFLKGIETIEKERRDRGVPLETNWLRISVGLPKLTEDTPVANQRNDSTVSVPPVGCDNTEPMKIEGKQLVTAQGVQEKPLTDVIRPLVNAGLSCRVIAEQLSFSGLNISYRTIARKTKILKSEKGEG